MVKKLKKVVRIAGMVCVLGWSIFGAYNWGQFDNARTLIAYAATATTTVMMPIEMEAPVLQRIADCESGNGGKAGTGKQFLANGTVVTNLNKNGSIDVGKYQINLNLEHIQEMSKLHLNPLTEEGNYAYAKYIYENHGTSDWSSSQKCWYR